MLNNNGFKLSDVSKQNLGYDLTGIDTKGKEVFIEVKSLDFAGQKFRLTNNEYAVAQYKKENYYVALIISNTDSLICFLFCFNNTFIISTIIYLHQK